MDEMSQFERIQLINKVIFELHSHVGASDTVLAESLIHDRLNGGSVEEFRRKISEVDNCVLPLSLLDSIDRLVQIMRPSLQAREPDKQQSSANDKTPQALSRIAPSSSTRDTIDDTSAYCEPPDSKRSRRDAEPRGRRRNRNRSRSRSRSPRSTPETRSTDGRAAKLRSYRSRRSDRSYKDQDDRRGFPVLHRVYDAHITAIKEFGAFAELDSYAGRYDGLIRVSNLADGYTRHPSDVVALGQAVKVKVIAIDGVKIRLSMEGVDQETGYELASQIPLKTGANVQASERGRETRRLVDGGSQRPGANRNRKRLSSFDRWEMKQLVASGVAKASDFLDMSDDDTATIGSHTNAMELEDEVHIEIRDGEPPFLVGRATQSLDLSPVRIVKAPEGSMNRAALSSSALVRERKELQKQNPRLGRSDSSNIHMPASESSSQRKRPDTTDWGHGKRTDLTIRQQRESMPIFDLRDRLIEAVRKHSVLIAVGETGSGKTTQITQYLAEAGFSSNGVIGCTQPRRLAALSITKRVAEEVGCSIGQEVGYSTRSEDFTSSRTKIKYMTDDTLLREILLDTHLQKYSVIMLDEVHERTIATDVLFVLLKKTLQKRPDLRLLITSATLDADKFSSYFNDAPIFAIPGRTFPVETFYSKEPEPDYLDAALVTVLQVHLTEPAGDILLFLTGQEEVDMACEILQERFKALGSDVPKLLVLPAYSALPTETLGRIFERAPQGSRKVIVATNIAETSVTIDDIRYVVDPGFSKQQVYNPEPGMETLLVSPVSQAQANQRAGRAGRTAPGKCFRLYTEAAFRHEMMPSPLPEIQRQNLSTTILMLKAMGIEDILHFGFMDPPAVDTTLTALKELYALGALDEEGLLTRLGRGMAGFPMEPSLAKVLIAAADLGCSDEMASIIAMLSLANTFFRSKGNEADQKKAKFHDPSGDHLTLLNIYNAWTQSGWSPSWCSENLIQPRAMWRAMGMRNQLVQIMERYHYSIISCGSQTDRVRRALCAGFFRNAARKEEEGEGSRAYKTLVGGASVLVHPSSAILGGQTEWVIYHELVLTTREYMRFTTSVEPQWLVEAAPAFLKISDAATTKHRDQQGIRPLLGKYEDDSDWRLSAQRRGGGHGGRGGRGGRGGQIFG